MPIKSKLGRRLFLGSVSSAAAALPFLRAFPLHAHGGEAPMPKVMFIAFPNGPLVGPNGTNNYQGWRPPGFSGSQSELPESLPDIFSPLDKHRERLVFLEGLSYVEDSRPHRSTTSLLTGRRRHVPGAGIDEYTSTGASVDHVLAQELGTNVLNTAYQINGYGSVGESYWSYSGPQARVLPYQNPLDTFAAVFGEGLDNEAAVQLLARRTSVLDVIAGDITSMKLRVPSADRPRLDAHFDAIRALELDLIATTESSCKTPGALLDYDHTANENAPRVFRDHASIITQAFACGHSRVATLQLGSLGGDRVRPLWPELGVNTNHTEHAICHEFAGTNPVGGTNPIDETLAIQLGLQKERAFSRLYADVLDMMETTLDIDGTPLLENTLVIYVRPFGQNHNASNVLWIAAGGAGVNVSGGRFLDVGGAGDPLRYYNDVLTTVCNTMGYDVDGFGDPDYCGTPIDLS